ncbi:MAG: type IV secretory system conjugative DNA transfer family protein, partial [Ureaplasma sp.]|nr:type IV secretory system conjugative DNA transfer family protein [Ureaplasma sp.]
EKRNNKKLLSKEELFEIQNEIEKENDRLEELKAKAIVNINNADEIINDIGLALYNNPNSKDKFWDDSAKLGFLAIYYLMLETIEEIYLNDKKYEEIDKDELIKAYSKINLPSIATVLTNLEDIKQYFKLVQNLKYEELAIKYKMKKSYINGASIFLNDSGNTLGNTVVTINTGLEQYKQSTMQNITTTNEIQLDKIADSEKPVALFIIVPDEKENLYKFATLLVDQVYKANISLASTKREQKLSRPLMFFLDEFGNIPTIPKFETMITVSRSRNIFFCIAIQGFNQIDSKYGNSNAKVIIENMLLHVYVSTTDQETIKYYQKRAGTYTVYKTSVSTNVQNETTKNSTSTNLDKKDLLNEDDIKNNPNDMLMIFYKNLNMSWVKTDPWWKCLDLHT